jgi:hypothetical protein
MNPTRNPVTGDFMITGHATDAYKDGWERIFGNKGIKADPVPEQEIVKETKEIEVKVTEFTGRRVFSIDVGDMTEQQASAFIAHIKEAFKKI